MNTISNKTAVTGLSGTAVVLLVYLFGLFGVELPAEIAAAIVTLVTALIGFLLPAKQGRYVDTTSPDDADLLVNRENVDPSEFEDAEEVV